MTEHEVEHGDSSTPVEGAAEASPVEHAMAELDTLGERELAEHPEVFERIHGHLDDALHAIDDA